MSLNALTQSLAEGTLRDVAVGGAATLARALRDPTKLVDMGQYLGSVTELLNSVFGGMVQSVILRAGDALTRPVRSFLDLATKDLAGSLLGQVTSVFPDLRYLSASLQGRGAAGQLAETDKWALTRFAELTKGLVDSDLFQAVTGGTPAGDAGLDVLALATKAAAGA